MFGFLVTNSCMDTKYKSFKRINFGSFYFYFNPLNKFYNDILFFEDDEKVVLLDGVIFNINELKKEFSKSDWKSTFEELLRLEPLRFMDKLRGSFAGVVLSKNDSKIIAFTCHMGERPIYYYNNEKIIIACHISFIKDVLNANNVVITSNISACYEMLCTGSCLSDNTLLNGVKRITAGKYLVIDSESELVDFYHRFENVPEYDMTLDECIEKGDILFRNAVDRIFRKSVEYGCQPECDLSGGLDSRMATWVAHDLGYKNVLNICYCVKNHLDNTISRTISHDLENEYFFLPMDSYILDDIDKKVNYFGGQVDYTLCTGAVKSIESIENNIGMCCTGLLGEIQNAYWVEGESHTLPNYWLEALRSKMFKLNVPEEYKKDYVNYEQMNLYELSGNFYMSSAIARQQMVEVTSPFIDVDYLDFVYRIPLKYRRHYKYVMAWMDKKYPKAAEYLWTTTGKTVKDSHDKDFNFCGAYDPSKNYFRRGINKLSRIFKLNYFMDSKYDMNPIEKWYNKDKNIKNKYEEYFKDCISLVSNEKLKADITTMFVDGKYNDKIMAINLLASFKNFIA